MPTREVDGSLMGTNEGAGTVLSSRAFRITSSAPIVVYQLNALAQTFSNDGSLLIPTNGLGKVHRVLAWPTGNPISVLGLPLSRAYITVVGVAAGTNVTIRTSTPTVAGSGYPALAKGGEVTVKLGPFDVFNLESDGMPGDFSGSTVIADQPVVVFTGTELSGSPGQHAAASRSRRAGGGTCCLDHLEEQLFPVESYGKNFAIPHSAIRSTTGYVEPDVIRIMGVATTATVKTNLAPPNDSVHARAGRGQGDVDAEGLRPRGDRAGRGRAGPRLSGAGRRSVHRRPFAHHLPRGRTVPSQLPLRGPDVVGHELRRHLDAQGRERDDRRHADPRLVRLARHGDGRGHRLRVEDLRPLGGAAQDGRLTSRSGSPRTATVAPARTRSWAART